MHDLRFALRQLLKNPGFTAVAVLTLALGIGATTAIFSIVNGVLLKPLPYEQPGQLVTLFELRPDRNTGPVSGGAFLDWREHSTSFDGLSVVGGMAANLTGTGQPERINGLRVNADYLRLLREQPLFGRGFLPEEDRVGGENQVVVLAHGLWQRRFGGDTNLVGKTILLDGESRTVVGILRPGALPTENDPDFLVPIVLGSREWHRSRSSHNLSVIGRLRPAITPESAQAELASIKQRLESEYPSWKKDWSVAVVPMHERVTRDMKLTLLVLLGAVGCVLLVACANVANLLLSKVVARQREMAVRAALGASRWRMIRQVLTESLVLAGLGGVLGVLIAYGGVEILLGWSQGLLRRLAEAHVDGRILAFTLLIALGTGVGFGLLPALQLSGPNLGTVLKAGGRGVVTGSRGRLQSGLIVAEVALALMLLTGAGLLVRSFARLLSVSPGFVTEGVLAMDLSMPGVKFPSATAKAEFVQRLADRVTAVPGVDRTGFTISLPMQGWSGDMLMRVVGRQDQPDGGYGVRYDGVSGDYFQTLGIPLLRGRTFSRADNSTNTPPVVVCNESLAKKVFPNQDPLGQHVRFFDDTQYEIVGVVADVKQTRLDDDRADRIYLPHVFLGGDGSLIVRTRVPPASLAEPIRQAILEVDADQPVSNIRTLEQDIAKSVAARRHTLTLLGLFAGVALGLAALGLYGVLAHAVALRRNEIGIRMALGTQRTDVLRLILRQGLGLTLLGLAIGFAGALGLTRVLRNQLYEVGPTDPLTFATVALLLVTVALLACWLPAQRAARVDPMEALRAE
ncbi:MAG: ABC transporter permease [Verrucomicrobiae bacterium]|nr:ABC transporter permease [Verrucomicrobiae bacterium]